MQVIAILVLSNTYISTQVRSYLALLLTVLVVTSCSDLKQEKAEQVNRALQDSLLSTTETWDLDLKIIEEGLNKVRLRGSYAASFNTDNINETRIRGPVSIKVFDTTNAVKTWVDSDSAIYRSEESEFEFFGDVQVRTRDKNTLESEYLTWNQGDNRISTPEFVIVITPQDSIAGTGFTGTSDLNRIQIENPSGQFTIE